MKRIQGILQSVLEKVKDKVRTSHEDFGHLVVVSTGDEKLPKWW